LININAGSNISKYVIVLQYVILSTYCYKIRALFCQYYGVLLDMKN
jgi:hypothetical protein